MVDRLLHLCQILGQDEGLVGEKVNRLLHYWVKGEEG